MRLLTLSALLGLVLCSCSVKEERLGCPCELSIYPDRSFDGEVYRRVRNSFIINDLSTDETYFKGSLDVLSLAGGKPEILMVPKAEVNLGCVFGVRDMKVDGSLLRLSEGRQADSVFVYLSELDCLGEKASDTLKLSKQWCSLRIVVAQPDEPVPSSCLLSGRWNGFDLRTLAAIEGEFYLEADRMGDTGDFMARIPRQGDDSLLLMLSYDHGFIKTCQLGRAIAEAYYDWKKKNLDDIVVYIDRGRVSISVVASDWEKGKDYGNVEM